MAFEFAEATVELTEVGLLAGAAFLTGIFGTVVARRVAPRLGMVDVPEPRKTHQSPTPLLGGVAIYTAVLVALFLFQGSVEIAQLIGILIAGTLMSLLGLWDDRAPLPPWAKLMGQLVGVVVLLIAGIQVALPLPVWGNLLVTTLWVLAVTNAFNLLDNLDGLAGGVGAIASGYFAWLAFLHGQTHVAALAAALGGACLAFLIFNFNPATIFLGDSGAMFIGLVLAAVGIKLRFPGDPISLTWVIPIIVLGVPLFDMGLVVVSRLRRGLNPISSPGLDHVSHRFVALGRSTRGVALIHYFASAVLGGVAVVVSSLAGSEPVALAIAAGVFVLGGIAMAWFERPGPDERSGTA